MDNSVHLNSVVMGTLITRDLGAASAAYTQYMHAHICDNTPFSRKQSNLWDMPHLENHRCAVLANDNGRPWLRIIEDKECQPQDNLKHVGWMALEVLVQDVDALAASLEKSPFEILRPVADLDVSDKIRAVQVRGPCGEILYLTQVKDKVPPFELPFATCPVDRLFIPVLCCHDRAETLAFYQDLSGKEGLSFETKITVLNQAYGCDLANKYQVATLQLGDKTLVEIDQVDGAQPTGNNPCGILMISFSGGGKDLFLQGPSGEKIEFLGKPS